MRKCTGRMATYIWNSVIITYDDLTGLRSPGAVSYNLNSLNITSETQGIKLKINSEVNDEVELVFDFKNSEDNTKNIQELDLSKMQLK